MAKKMKKLLALVLAIAMVMSFMSVGAFAVEGEGSGTEPATTYTVTYAYEGEVPAGAIELLPAEASYAEGAEVTVAENPTLDGYNFSGWSQTDTFTMPAEAVVITGSWTANEPVLQTTTYTVTVNYVDENDNPIATSYVTEPAEGGSYDVSAYAQVTIEGYTYSAVSGDSVTGTLDGNKVITVTYAKIPVKEALDLTAVAEASGEGWTWADDTLTLNGATIDSSDDDVAAPAVKLPNGATIIVNGVNTIHASDDQNGIICAGALTIQGNGTLNVSCYNAVRATSVVISDIAVNFAGERNGIYAYNEEGAASVELTNVSGTIVGGSYAGIFVDCEYSGANSSCVLDGCDLTVISNATRMDMRCRRSGIAVYSGIASVVCTMEIKNSTVDATGYDAGLGMNSYANGAATATMLIENSTVNAIATSAGWAGIFASTTGKTEDDVCIITIKNSDVAAQGVKIGIMTSAACGVSEVNIDDSSVMVSGETVGVRVRNNGSGAKTATFTNNALLVVAGQTASVVDEGIYTLDDTSKIVTATKGSITANGDGTFAIAKGSEVTAEYAAESAAESVDYTFYMQAGGVDKNRDIWGYDTFSEIDWTAEEIIIYTEDELHEFAMITQGKHPVVAQRDFAGQTVKLGADITLRDYWYHRDAQGNALEDYRIVNFKGTFDGRHEGVDHKILNMKYRADSSVAGSYIGLAMFRDLYGTVQNLTIDGIECNSSYNAIFSAVANRCRKEGNYAAKLDNVTAQNIRVNMQNNLASDEYTTFCGLVYNAQYSTLNNCHLKNAQVTIAGSSYYGISGLVMNLADGTKATSCSVSDVNVIVNGDCEYIGGFAGAVGNTATADLCTVSNFSAQVKGKNTEAIGGFAGASTGNWGGGSFAVTNSTVSGLNIEVADTQAPIGGFFGTAGGGGNQVITGCSVSGTITANGGSKNANIGAGGFLGTLGGRSNSAVAHQYTNCSTTVNVSSENVSVGGFIGAAVKNDTTKSVSGIFDNCAAKGNVSSEDGVAGGFAGNRAEASDIFSLTVKDTCSAVGDVSGTAPTGPAVVVSKGGTYTYDPELILDVAVGYRALDNGDGTWTVFPDNGKEVVKVAFHRWNDELNTYENWRTVEVFKGVDFSEDTYDNTVNYSHPDYRFANGITELDEEADDKTEQDFGFWTDAPNGTKLVLDNEIEVLADMNVYAVYGDFVCEIVETGVKYETLTEAVADANKLDGANTIKMLKSIDFDSTKALDVKGNLTIIGEQTISRGAYTGTLFNVTKGSCLTLDDGLTIDGNNNWTFDSATYNEHLTTRSQQGIDVYSTEYEKAYITAYNTEKASQYFTPEEGAPVATAYMITVSNNGTLNLKGVTIQNNYTPKSGLVNTSAGATVNLEGAQIKHCASVEGSGTVVNAASANITVNMKQGTLINGNHVGGNHGIFRVYSGATFNMYGGTVSNTTGWNSNGIVIGSYKGTVNLYGGEITGSSSVYGSNNGRNAPVYLHNSAVLNVVGGSNASDPDVYIHHNLGGYGGIDAPWSNGSLNISGVTTKVKIMDNTAWSNNGRHDMNASSVMSISAGIYTQDVDQWCADGYVCIPYDDSARIDDYIVVPGYRVSYYAVSTETVKDETTGTETTKLVNTLVHKELLPLNGKDFTEVDLFANNKVLYIAADAENNRAIKTWFTKEELVDNKVALSEEYDFSTEVLANVNLYGEWTQDVVYYPEYNVPTGDVPIDENKIPLAGIPSAFREDHIAYIIGDDNGLARPEANITRAEVAMIFYRLLNDETREMYSTNESYFPDVKEDDWFCTAVSTLNAMGIIYGKPDGSFAPDAYITRAEFAAIAARFDPIDPEDADFFTDVDGHWAEVEILIAATKGWVEGYEGLFRPDDNITRAEAMTMVNRVLQRNPESVDDLLDNMIVWEDNMDTKKWYYLAVQEATNGHDYERKESGYEYWTALNNAEK